MSPGFTARPPGMFSTAATRPTTLRRSRSCAASVRLAITAAAPLISNFISSIPGGSLSEMPPVSKVTPLPTSTTGGPPLRCALVLEHDEARRLLAALRDREQAAHALAPDGRLIEHLGAQPRVALGERARLFRQVKRRAHVGGQVRQVPLDRLRGRNRRAFLEAALRGTRRAHRAGEHLLQRRRRGLLGGLQIVDAVERGAGELGDLTPEIVVVELLGLGTVDGDGAAVDARACERCKRRLAGAPPRLALELLLGAEPREQHPGGLDPGQIAHEQRLAGTADEVATPEQPLQPAAAGGIDRACLAAEFALLEHPEHQAVHRECREAFGPDTEFHCVSPSR